MFSSALKSFTSNISSNYSISPNPSSFSGPWKIFDGKKKSTGKAVSVFVFDKKSLEPQGGGLGPRSSASSLKRVHEEVIERLKREASNLARLRHPSILELAEPVEETRNGLMFATEQVTASLAGLLLEKDEQEKAGGRGGRSSRYVVEEGDGKGRRRRELEIDELEIQKGLLQVGKGLEFLHESAGLVHGNLTPEAIFINAKSDWKISGLGFSGPGENSNKPTSLPAISLSEVLNHDPRLPRSVQLDLDYTSPDFAMDSNVSSAADMFSLGLLIIALYNSPHKSPIETNNSLSSFKRVFSSSAAVPSQTNNFLSSAPVPKDLVSGVLPRMITRRPAQRLTAREFQEAQYFDNILVSTIRFLDSLPAKTPNEKQQFMRGLPRILNQFPKSVLEKKVLPALIEEMKDRELLALILQNVFKIIGMLPSGKRSFTDRVIPRLRDVFLNAPASKAAVQDRDSAKEAGLMVLLENMNTVAENSSGKEFKDDILPIIIIGLESPTHSLVDASLRTLSAILSILDFSTVKNELFPVIASVFAKTSSLGIKTRGLEALQILCGGTTDSEEVSSDGLDGMMPTKPKGPSTSILDKYTIQEKVVPLLKAIKTKEPAVMMAALSVFREVGKIADSDFLAMEVLPIMWSFSLGPLLNLQQFQAFMALIKSLSSRIEQEQTRKLQEMGSSTASAATNSNNFNSFGATANGNSSPAGVEGDFESLVLGKKSPPPGSADMMDDWGSTSVARPSVHRAQSQTSNAPAFAWSTPSSTPASRQPNLAPPMSTARTITPDHSLSTFASLQPSSSSANVAQSNYSQPLQLSRPGTGAGLGMGMSMGTMSPPPLPSTNNILTPSPNPAIDWSSASKAQANPWHTSTTTSSMSSSMARPQQQQQSSFALPPPTASPYSSFGIAPPPQKPGGGGGMGMGMANGASIQGQQGAQGGNQKQGMDKYESLI
ncbi:kinase-like protein [Aulographum hederae CBS 113979]|uniref:Kinase-like protein n=1 Tax=Aulographum hederae CBS 113979 TaxID=1176131 RepID=A0A6G1GVH9_9PEZI|nr:kinase-like protein [Aulographum hederae CBS 113979]